MNFKMAENPSKASRRSRVCFVSSFGTRHYFDWIFGILEERAGASPDQWVLVLLPLKGQERIKNVVILLSFLLKQKKQKFKTVNSLHAKTTKLVRLRDPSRSKSYYQYEKQLFSSFGVARKAPFHGQSSCFAAQRM